MRTQPMTVAPGLPGPSARTMGALKEIVERWIPA
jgi:hypothetical protein